MKSSIYLLFLSLTIQIINHIVASRRVCSDAATILFWFYCFKKGLPATLHNKRIDLIRKGGKKRTDKKNKRQKKRTIVFWLRTNTTSIVQCARLWNIQYTPNHNDFHNISFYVYVVLHTFRAASISLHV